jgi:hypothetical protein
MSNRHDSWFAALAGRKAPATLDEHLAAAAKRAHEADTQAALDTPDEARRRRLVNLYEAGLRAGERRAAATTAAATPDLAAAGRGGSATGRGWALGQIGAAAAAGVAIALLGLQLLKPSGPNPAGSDPALAKGGSAASAPAAVASQATATHQVVATPQPEAAARQLAAALAEAGVTADVQADGKDAWRLEATLTPEQAERVRPALAARGLELPAGGTPLRVRFLAI